MDRSRCPRIWIGLREPNAAFGCRSSRASGDKPTTIFDMKTRLFAVVEPERKSAGGGGGCTNFGDPITMYWGLFLVFGEPGISDGRVV